MSSYVKQVRYELFEASDKVPPRIWGTKFRTELLEAFNFQCHIATVSPLCHARDKISSDAFLAFFNQFQPEPKYYNLYHVSRLFAHDGSDLKFSLNRDDETTYINQGEKSCNLIHVNALYDLLNRNFKALSIENKCEYDERKSLI